MKPLLALILLFWVSAKNITLHESSNQYFKLIYGYPQDGEDLRFRVEVKMDKALTSSTVATVVWMDMGTSTYSVTSGTTREAFGIMYYWNTTTWLDGSDIKIDFFGSTNMTYVSSVYTWVQDTIHDFANVTKGTEEILGGLNIHTTYGLDTSYLAWSNLPAINSSLYYKWFAQYGVATSSGTIDTNQTTTLWTSNNVNIAVETKDLTCLSGSAVCKGHLMSIQVIVISACLLFLLEL
jgi:hypothetical protein